MWTSLGGPLFCVPHAESSKRSQLADLEDVIGFPGSFPSVKMVRRPDVTCGVNIMDLGGQRWTCSLKLREMPMKTFWGITFWVKRRPEYSMAGPEEIEPAA